MNEEKILQKETKETKVPAFRCLRYLRYLLCSLLGLRGSGAAGGLLYFWGGDALQVGQGIGAESGICLNQGGS